MMAGTASSRATIPDRDLETAAREAWRALFGDASSPSRVELLKRSRDGTAVYRLCGATLAVRPVIAKRAPRATAQVERTVYERMLSRLTEPSLALHGAVDEPGKDFCWLLLEEGQGQKYRRELRSHRAAAGRWLRSLHAALADLEPVTSMPARRPPHYLALLRSARAAVASRLRTAGAESDRVLESMLVQCEQLMAHWEELEAACAPARDTLVHGDFIDNNVLIRSGPSGLVVLPFDWEKAGWGVPAEDLSSVDLNAYCESSGGSPPTVDRAALGRLAAAGSIFRCIVFLDWATSGRDLDRVEQEVEQIELCSSWLDTLMEKAEWKN
jgi:aminoglycoside phosphotransferase (APT) family kinase protein